MEQELKAGYIDDFYCEFYESGMPMAYLKDEVDDVLAEKDAEICELKAKIENVNELVKAANKFVDDLKNSDCFKKDDEIKRLKKSVQFFSDLHHNECESAKECFRRLMDLGLIDGWGLTEKFFVMPKYTKERLTQFEKQESEIRRLTRALWIARARRAIEKIAWFKLWNASISTMNPEDGARQEYDKWKKNLGKFLKKAEVYR